MDSDRYTVTRVGIVIGCAYNAPAPQPTKDAEAIQAALLAKHPQYFERVLDWINHAAPWAYGLMVLAGFVFWAVARWMR